MSPRQSELLRAMAETQKRYRLYEYRGLWNVVDNRSNDPVMSDRPLIEACMFIANEVNKEARKEK